MRFRWGCSLPHKHNRWGLQPDLLARDPKESTVFWWEGVKNRPEAGAGPCDVLQSSHALVLLLPAEKPLWSRLWSTVGVWNMDVSVGDTQCGQKC